MPSVTIEITDAEAARLAELAAYFKQSPDALLRDVFTDGLREAETVKELRDDPPLFDPATRSAGGKIDDDIPF